MQVTKEEKKKYQSRKKKNGKEWLIQSLETLFSFKIKSH